MWASNFLKFPIQNRAPELDDQRICPTLADSPLRRGRWVYEKAEKEAGWEQRVEVKQPEQATVQAA